MFEVAVFWRVGSVLVQRHAFIEYIEYLCVDWTFEPNSMGEPRRPHKYSIGDPLLCTPLVGLYICDRVPVTRRYPQPARSNIPPQPGASRLAGYLRAALISIQGGSWWPDQPPPTHLTNPSVRVGHFASWPDQPRTDQKEVGVGQFNFSLTLQKVGVGQVNFKVEMEWIDSKSVYIRFSQSRQQH